MTLVHEALYYATVDEFLAGTLGFVQAGMDAGEPTLVALPQPRLSLLKDELKAPTDGMWFVDMAEEGRNPARLLPWVLGAFAAKHLGPVRIVGEPIFVGRTAAELGPCVQHEALVNVAFAGRPVSILCPYDTGALPELVEHAERTHPIIVVAGQRRPSRDYTEPAAVVAMCNQPLPEPGRYDHRLVFDLQGLAGVRRLVAGYASSAGLSPERSADLQLAATEICTNAVVHDGDGLGTLRLWTDESGIVCEVYGAGQIADIMAGRMVPAPDRQHGRGLLLANRLCDLVQTHVAATGTWTRLSMRLSAG